MRFLFQNLLNLRRIAVENRLSDDIELYIEKCYRYYSRTYGPDLETLKQTMTAEQVALVFMEDEMIDWTAEEVIDVQRMLSTTDVPVLDSNMIEDDEDGVSDDEWIAQQEAIAKKEEARKAKEQEEIAKKTHEAIEKLTQSFKSLEKAVDKKE